MPSTRITMIVAPDIPESERQALEQRWRETVRDPSHALVVNYNVTVFNVEVTAGAKVVVCAPGLPLSEHAKLRERVDKAMGAEEQADRLVVCNYDCWINVMYPENTVE